MRRLLGLALIAVLVLVPGRAIAQEPPARLKVFLDCWECDTEYLRQNLLFVEYVRDRLAADLHVLVTTQSAGSGGTSWTVRVLGLGRFLGQDRSTVFSTPQNATNDDRRREFARVLRLALAGYAAGTSVARDLDVSLAAESAATKAPQKDKWNYWVYRLGGNGSFSGEESSRSQSYRFNVSAGRVTERWKISLSASTNISDSWFKLSDGRKITTRTDSSNAGGLIVRALGPRLSAGMRVNASKSSFSNTRRSASVYPGVEFNFFPYAEYQKRRLTIWYEVGPNFYDYDEPTIFDKLSERVFKHQMDISYQTRQTWGSAGAFLGMSQHLGHLDRYSVSLNADAEIRLFKGFSFNVYGNYSKINDQIALVKGGATQEEILLRLRQLETNYRYSFSTGFSYTFGSIFNSVVNPRFSGQ